MIDSFRLGGESGLVTASRLETSGYPGLSATYRDWTVRADCGDFQGEFLAVLTDEDVAEFFRGLGAAVGATEDGEYPVELGSGRGCAATVTIYRFQGRLRHGVISLTPHGDDPIPCLTMWLDTDPAAIQAEASRVLAELS
jgi:hypothetical protein